MHRVSSFFLGLSIVSFLSFCYLFTNQLLPQSLAFSTPPEFSQTESATQIPTGIRIPSATINLPIVYSQIVNGEWEVTTKGVSYLSSSALPGDNGNSILYGHNWLNLLGNLYKANIGDSLYISHTDGSEDEFTIVEKKVVEPTDISVLQNTTDSTITLYTCTGFLDSKRLVIVAKKKVNS